MSYEHVILMVLFVTCIFLVWFFSHRAKHRERLMFIEKGLPVEELVKSEKKFRFPWLRIGIIIIGLSIGLMIITVLNGMNILSHENRTDALPLAILGICGGISMIIANSVNGGRNNR